MEKTGLPDGEATVVKNLEKVLVMKGYEYVTSFLPNYSNDNYDRMMKFFKNIGFDGEWYVSQEFGDWYIEFEETGHERDSSGDCVTIWRSDCREKLEGDLGDE